MSDPLARAMREDELLGAVMHALKLQRWLAVHVRNSRAGVTQGDPGNPDILACRPPRLLLIELKREGNKRSPLQDQWAGALQRVPGIEYYLWMPSDWRTGRIEEALK